MIEVGEVLSKNIYVSLSVLSVVTALVTYLITGSIKETEFNKRSTLALTKNTAVAEQDTAKQPEEKILVDLSGAVLKPGIYALPANSRIADLLNLGGGIDNSASDTWVSKNLNLALKLSDSQKVYIPFEWDVVDSVADLSADLGMTYADAVSYISAEPTTSFDGGTKVSDDAKGLININTASLSELDTLPGIGAVYAAKIVNNRPYKNAQELSQKAGIATSTVDKFVSLISF